LPPAPLSTGGGAEPSPGATEGPCEGTVTVLVECRTPPPRLLLFGAVDFAAALARVGRFLGMRVTVCDTRPALTTRARFPDAHEVVVDRPERLLAAEAAAGRLDGRTAVCVLGHDPALDVPALREALRLPVGYVGAMGSRRTHRDRLRRLAEAGLRPGETARLRSPIGLDLGARTPEETALSIAAEIVALRRGGGGGPLTDAVGPIHRDVRPAAHGAVRGDAHGDARDEASGGVRREPSPPACPPAGSSVGSGSAGPGRAPGRPDAGRPSARARPLSPGAPDPARAAGGRRGR
ncbi:hypothetical protein FNQ90_22035, partial [Streptomyces alkaliphilus]